MGTTIEKLNKVLESKNRLKQSLINKGQNVGDKFSEYPTAVDNIPVGITPTGTKEINTSNAIDYETEVDVTNYENVVVKGSQVDVVRLEFTENNASMSFDVKPYFMRQVDIVKPSTLIPSNIKKNVNVAGIVGTLEEGITPTGTLQITDNGEKDVTQYAKVNVNVPQNKPTLNAPTISLTDNTLTITNPSSNGGFVTSYDVYEDGSLLTNITTTTLDLSTLITEAGTYAITVKAKGTNFNDSASSNSVDYVVSSGYTINYSLSDLTYMVVDNVTYTNESGTLVVPENTVVSFSCSTTQGVSTFIDSFIEVDGVTVSSDTWTPIEDVSHSLTVTSNINVVGITGDNYEGQITITTQLSSSNGYTVKVIKSGMYGDYGYYSLDNGATWENFNELNYDEDVSGYLITNVTQIKFKIDDYAYNNGISTSIWCEEIGLNITQAGPRESENYTLTSDIVVEYYDVD